ATIAPTLTIIPTPQPKKSTLKIKKSDFKASESPLIKIDGDGTDFQVELTNPKKESFTPRFSFKNDNGRFLEIEKPRQFRPGKYHLKITDGQGQVVLEQDFTWGVLAINTNKSIYLPNETANLAMAVLDEKSMMVCDAKLKLTIKEDSQNINDELSTENGKIKVNQECKIHDFTLKPDYEAQYQVKGQGRYEMSLTAETKNGNYTIADFFEVKENISFEIERDTATRIYPIKDYPVTFNIKANEDFEGTVEEIVPRGFEILPALNNRSFDEVIENEQQKIIRWQMSIKKDERISLGYNYNAPDESPYFYLLGKLGFLNKNNVRIFEEARFWQIASDAPVYKFQSGYYVGTGQCRPV
ncbi:MAG: hypothetical protein Q7U68_07000, partial [Candidatus Roizmanbacteria bacterium]|nr:hypothetical protein [Candidatus Roizmanbacteria bacterium]